MNLFTRIANAFRNPPPYTGPFAPEVRQLPTVAVYQYGKPTWPAQNMWTAIRSYEQVVVVFACVNLIADAAATATVRVYDETDSDAELPDHPLRQLLRHPNTYMSEAEWLNAMVKIGAVCGFAVSEIERAAYGRPVALHPLRSDWLAPIPRSDNMVDWQYSVPGREKVILAAEDVVAWTYQGGPLLALAGITPAWAAGREIAIENEATGFIKAFFDSGAVPQLGLVPHEGASFDQAEADVLREKFKAFAGQPWEPIVMQAISDVKRLGFDLNEMAYKDLRGLTSSQICTAFRVPPVMLGTLVGLENSPWSKYEEARLSFYQDTITPLWARLDGALSRSLLPEFETKPNISLEFDTSAVPAMAEDESDDWLHATAPGVGEFTTVNDRRALVGLPPIQGGDVRILTIAQIEVPAIAENGTRANGHHDALWREVRPLALNGHHGHRLPPTQRAAAGQTAKQTILRLSERAEPLLRRFWRAQGRRFLDAFLGRSTDAGLERRAAEVLDWAEEDRQLRDVLRKIYIMDGKAAFANSSTLLNIEIAYDLVNPNITRLLGELGKRVSGINETTRAELEAVITESLSEGVSIDYLSNVIEETFDSFAGARATTVARTETQVAYNRSATLSYQESGVVEAAELLDNPAHDEDYGASDGLSCAERNGLVVPLSSVERHIEAEHPNGTLAVLPVLSTALGEAE